MIKVIITDDHQIVIDGLKIMLESEPGIEVVGQANHGGELLSLIQNIPADIILLDISMPVMNGIDACRQITDRYPQMHVIALTMMQETSLIKRMLKAGAKGYLMKNTGREELLLCIKSVHAGKTYYAEEVKSAILSEMSESRKEKNEQYPRLSRREKQILKLIIDEFTTAEIAKQLSISFGTVETHRRNIMNKLGARNTAGMVRIALEHRLLDT